MLRIIVPIKQVPDMSRVRFDTEKGVIDRASAGSEINPFDLNALEAAVQLKEKLGGVVSVISMGPQTAETALKDAIARGADRAILLSDKEFAGADTLATSYTLAGAIKKLGDFDLIICGEKTVDGDTGQVGAELAEHLDLPYAAYVSKLTATHSGLTLTSEFENERYLISGAYPILISVTKDVNNPRLPTLRDKLAARKAAVEVWDARELANTADRNRFGTAGSPTTVYKITAPAEEGRKGKIHRKIEDEALEEIASVLGECLK
ncbi:MAG: electron transfer flavoprotein subunit beta/FixA family protein [Chloroflexota bacterium]